MRKGCVLLIGKLHYINQRWRYYQILQKIINVIPDHSAVVAGLLAKVERLIANEVC